MNIKPFFKLLMLIVICSVCEKIIAQTTAWQWANGVGGLGNDVGRAICVDNSGNSFVTGFFHDTVVFGGFTLISAGGPDIFVAKYNSAGVCQWAKRGGGPSPDEQWGDSGFGIDLDEFGNCYVAGNFTSSASFGSFNLTGRGIFLVKYDINGNEMWAVQSTGGTDGCVAFGLSCDASGNSFVTGILGNGNYMFGSFSLPAYASFLVKIESTGNVAYAEELSGALLPHGIDVDIYGNIFLTGIFSGADSINNQYYTPVGGYDLFIAKLKTDGSYDWFTHAGGTLNGSYAEGNGISIDLSGNLYATGSFIGELTIGSTFLTATSGHEIFVTKYDSSGNAQWSHSSSSTSDNFSNAISSDPYGNSFVTGTYGTPFVFGNDTFPIDGRVFVIKMDSSGNYLWSNVSTGQTGVGYGIGVDNTGSCHITGDYKVDPMMFGPISVSSPYFGGEDIFIAKLGPSTGIETLKYNTGISLYPNPALTQYTINLEKFGIQFIIELIEIYNVLGEKILDFPIDSADVKSNQAAIDISNLPGGIYFVKVSGIDFSATRKLIINR